tara:strand:- start:1619 stop:1858 length:240 start_codon:yes stop_codon:yes gene_type:complete
MDNFIAIQPIGSWNVELINMNQVQNIILSVKGDADDRAIIKFVGGYNLDVKKSELLKKMNKDVSSMENKIEDIRLKRVV